MDASVAARPEGAGPQTFTRKSSGLVRVMSPTSAFFYNVLTMGLIFPWTYLWGPFAAPGANLVVGIGIAVLAQIVIAVAYTWLAASMPRSGGDYVFQSRIFNGPIGFISVFGGFVIWILQWVALSGWLMSVLAFAPLFLSLGAMYDSSALLDVGTWFQSAAGIVIVSIVQAFVAMVLLVSGFRNYVRLQRYLMVATLAAFVAMIILFLLTSQQEFVTRIDDFAAAVQGSHGFYDYLLNDVRATGFSLNAPFSFVGTLLIAPIAWTSLQWSLYSAQQGSEIKSAGSIRHQLWIMIGSTVFVGVLLMILAAVLDHTVGKAFLNAAGASYYGGVSKSGNGMGVITPFPNVLAMMLTGTPVLLVIIALGYMANAFQVTCNCYIGMTRVLVAMGLDRTLPSWFSKVHGRLRSPVNAHLAYFLAAIPVIWAYSYVSQWATWTLGVTFACGYVFTLSVLAAVLLPFRAPDIYRAAPHRKIAGVPLVTAVGLVGFAAAAAMCVAFLTAHDLGLTGATPIGIVIGVIVFSALVYLVMWAYNRSRGVDSSFAFKALPPE